MPHNVVVISVCHGMGIPFVIVWPSCFCRSKEDRHELVLLMCGKNGPTDRPKMSVPSGIAVFSYVWYGEMVYIALIFLIFCIILAIKQYFASTTTNGHC